jgi:hypothetical protein
MFSDQPAFNPQLAAYHLLPAAYCSKLPRWDIASNCAISRNRNSLQFRLELGGQICQEVYVWMGNDAWLLEASGQLVRKPSRARPQSGER